MRRLSILITSLIFLWGCGSEREIEPKVPVPVPTQTPNPNPGGGTTFADVQAITQTSCVRCHASDGFLKTEAGWRGSAAKTRVSNSSMPPAGTAEARGLSAADRAKLAGF